MADQYATKIADEGAFVRADVGDPIARARELHHLATADPEPERDGMQTGPSHEAQYGLERAAGSFEVWASQGVHPTENRALVDGEQPSLPKDAAKPASVANPVAPAQS